MSYDRAEMVTGSHWGWSGWEEWVDLGNIGGNHRIFRICCAHPSSFLSIITHYLLLGVLVFYIILKYFRDNHLFLVFTHCPALGFVRETEPIGSYMCACICVSVVGGDLRNCQIPRALPS
jgi:hypothetical protein